MNCYHGFDAYGLWIVMNPELLRSFLAVARCLNFTKAAEELALTQPAVSRQIHQLERELGVVLFERLGRTVQLTDAGRELVSLGEQLLGQVDRVVEAVRRYGSAERGVLRIGASTTPGYYVLPPVLGRFRRAHRGVELQFMVENSSAIERRVLHNELDLGFVGGHPTTDTLQIASIADDELVCFCAPNHPLAGRRRVNARSLGDPTWVVRERGSATRELSEQWLEKAGTRMRKTIELDSPEGIKALVAAGIGISFMSILGVKEELRRGQLERINLSGLRLTRSIYVVRHPDKHVSPVMCGLLELLGVRQ
ncbi:MAG: LysR family transcriptional regulator [Phycisphaerae bacterium]